MKTLHRGIVVLAWVALLSLLACSPTQDEDTAEHEDAPSAVAEEAVTSGAVGATPDAPCAADPAWFKGPKTKFPVDVDFPKDPSNCDFHQWAWQTFLALMSPADASSPDGPRVFEQMGYPDDLFLPNGPTQRGYPGRSLSEKSPPYFINQAGPADNVLFDQKGQLVYYSVFVNDVYWNYVVDNEFYDTKVLSSPKAKAARFIVGSHELKVSWRVAEDLDTNTVYIDDADDYYTIEATVPGFAVNNDVVVATKKQRNVRLAMVGMHVVGVVQGHSEFVWATFEQLGNAPDNASGKVATEGPFGKKPGVWSFYDSKTNSDYCNLFDDSAPTSPANVTRLIPWGGGSDENTGNIIELNESVWDDLPAGRRLMKDYFEVGAIWTDGTLPLNNSGFPPGVDPKQTLKGSFQADNTQAGLANTTMESFTQTESCFSCHNAGDHSVAVLQSDGQQLVTTVSAKPLNLSHFIVNYQAAQQVEGDK